jgi:hypothetical protein
MNKAREFSRIVERIKQGDKLSKTDWVAIGAMPLTFVIAGYYAFNVASKKTGEFVSSMKQQYHSVLKSIWLAPDASLKEIATAAKDPENITKIAKEITDPHRENGSEWDDQNTAPIVDPALSAANNDHAESQGSAHPPTEHPGHDRHAA